MVARDPDVPAHPSDDRRVARPHIPLAHRRDGVSPGQAPGKMPTNTAFDDLPWKSRRRLSGIAFNGLRYGKRRATTSGHHDPVLIAPEPKRSVGGQVAE
jgi:hypothetical protein